MLEEWGDVVLQLAREHGAIICFGQKGDVEVTELVRLLAQFSKGTLKEAGSPFREDLGQLAQRRTGAAHGNTVGVQVFDITVCFDAGFVGPHRRKQISQNKPHGLVCPHVRLQLDRQLPWSGQRGLFRDRECLDVAILFHRGDVLGKNKLNVPDLLYTNQL